MSESRWTAFRGHKCVAAGAATDVALAVKQAHDTQPTEAVVIIDDATGRAVDIDLRGDAGAAVDRVVVAPKDSGPRGRGRPRLGVTAREVTLLPRHWAWLAQQPGGVSGTLRRLVDAARASGVERRRHAQVVADRFMVTIAGDLPGYEEASRALYASDGAQFERSIAGWPADVRAHVCRLAGDAFNNTVEN